MLVFWQEFDPRFFVLFALFLGLMEIALLVRWRIYIVCPFCKFDPITYLKDPEKVAARVSQHLKHVSDNDEFTLMPNPKRNLHHRKIVIDPTKQNKSDAVQKVTNNAVTS